MNIIRKAPRVFANLTKPGPSPQDARLELRQKDWISKSGRHHTGEKYFYVVDGPVEYSTKFGEDNADKAKAVLKLHRDKKILGLLGQHAPGELAFKEVLRDHDHEFTRLAVTPEEKRHAQVVGYQCRTLIRHLGNLTVAKYVAQHSLDFYVAYVAERNMFYDTHPDTDRKDPETTAVALLKLLQKAIDSFIERRGLLWSKTIHVPKKRKAKKPKRWLRKSEAALLLWACIYQYDKVKGCFKTKEVTAPDGSVRHVLIRHEGQIRIERYYLSRLIRYILETGTRHETSFMTMWGSRPDMPGIECDSDGGGKIHRRGSLEEDTRKARPSSPIHRRLRYMVRIWSRMDGHIDRLTGAVATDKVERYLILDKNLQPYRDHLCREFNALVREVGLRGVSVHTLKHTAVNYAYQAGQTRKNAAVMLGTTENTLNGYYRDWLEESDAQQILAQYDDPARAAAFRAIRHSEPLKAARPRNFAKPFKQPKQRK